MKKFSKVLSIVLTLALILSGIPAVFSVSAATTGGLYEYRNTFDSADALDDFDVYWVPNTQAGATVYPEADKTAHLSLAGGKVQRINDLAALGNQTAMVLKDYEFENFEVVLEYVDGDSWGWTTVGFRQEIAGSYGEAPDGGFAYIDTAGQAWARGEGGLYYASWGDVATLPGYVKGAPMTMTVRLVGQTLTVIGQCDGGAAATMFAIDVSSTAGGKQLSFNFVGDNSAIDAITVKRLDANGKQIPVMATPAPAASSTTYVNDFATAADLDDFDIYWVPNTGDGMNVTPETNKTAHLSLANGKVQRVNDLSALGNQTSMVLKDYVFENFEAVIHYVDGDSWGWTTLGFRQDIAGSYAIGGDGAYAYIDTAGQAWAWGENGAYFGSHDPVYLPGYVKGAPMTVTVRLVGQTLTVIGQCGDSAPVQMYSIDISAVAGGKQLSFNFVGDNSAIDWISVTRLDASGNAIPLVSMAAPAESETTYVNTFDSADDLADFNAYFLGDVSGTPVAENTSAHWTVANGYLSRVNDINAAGATSNVASLVLKDKKLKNFEAVVSYKDGLNNWGWTVLGFRQYSEGTYFVNDGAGAYIDVAGQAHLWGGSLVGGPHNGAFMAGYQQGAQLLLKVRVVNGLLQIYGNGVLLQETTMTDEFSYNGKLSLQSVGNGCDIDWIAITRLDDNGNAIAFDGGLNYGELVTEAPAEVADTVPTSTMLGASVRGDDEIRFGIEMSAKGWEEGTVVEEVLYGTLFMPTETLGENELTFTTEGVLDVPTTKWQENLPGYEDRILYTSVLTDIPTADTAITARGYMLYRIGDAWYVQYTEAASRTINGIYDAVNG